MQAVEAPSNEKISKEVETFARKLAIPPCPEIAAKVMEESRAEDPDFNRIGALISKDLVLSAMMLRTVNSPFYGLRTPVNSIQQALVMLGLRTVSSLVIGLLMRQAFPALKSSGMNRFWDQSSKQAALGTYLAQTTGIVPREVAYTFGLFRHCGMPILRTQHPDYEPVLAGTAEERGRALIEMEGQRFGVTHAQLGFLMARGWYMPEDACDAILRTTEYPVDDERRGEAAASSLRLAALGIVAEWIGDRIAGNDAKPAPEDMTFAVMQLGISSQQLVELVKKGPEAIAGAT